MKVCGITCMYSHRWHFNVLPVTTALYASAADFMVDTDVLEVEVEVVVTPVKD